MLYGNSSRFTVQLYNTDLVYVVVSSNLCNENFRIEMLMFRGNRYARMRLEIVKVCSQDAVGISVYVKCSV